MSTSSFDVRDFSTGAAKAIRSTVINPVSPDADVHIPHHVICDETGRYVFSPNYEQVASSTTAVLGGSGAVGDYLDSITIVPESTTAGSVKIFDGSTSPDVGMTVFFGGTVSDVKSWTVAIKATSTSGAWSVTTGSGVHVIASGRFT